MAIRIKPSLKINGIYWTSSLTLPLKLSSFLDEQLDEGYLTLVATTRKKPWEPLSRVELTMNNEFYLCLADTPTPKKKFHKFFLVASDRMKESICGGNRYDHELYIIEETKFLEMFLIDSLTFTNDMGRKYSQIAQYIVPTVEGEPPNTLDGNNQYYDLTSEKKIIIKNISTISGLKSEKKADPLENHWYYALSYVDIINKATGAVVKHYTGTEMENDQIFYISGLGNIQYEIYYKVRWYSIISKDKSCYITYDSITYIPNYLPMKQLTVTDGIKRVLDLAEPLLYGEGPRFHLNAEQAEEYDKVYLPEMAITQCTLREALQEIGKVIHGEPRLTTLWDGSGEISFDKYGETIYSTIKRHRYSECVSSIHINEYCTSLDSNAQNLVNQLSYAQGAVIEPFAGGYKTVRTETAYIRIEEGNMHISTARPIYKIIRVECGYIPNNGSVSTPVDITPYVFEKTTYDSQLSAYSSAYPYSKAYGIYYTQGEKNIYGLTFKAEDQFVIAPAFGKYSIVNILERVTGKTLDVGGNNFYPCLAFRVTYIPFFDVRVSQTKSYYKEYSTPAVIAYNQSANVIENKYYGENIKGTIARLGNVEKVYTYLLASFLSIPKVGTKFDDDYYISAVTSQFYTNAIVCTVTLSKDFNRLSRFIGISSTKRQWEVSEKSAYDRTVLYKEYIVLGDEEETDENSTVGNNFMNGIMKLFSPSSGGTIGKVTNVFAWGGTYKHPSYENDVSSEEGYPLPCVCLPVVSTALGNSVVFIWSYEDNYSAGNQSVYINGEIEGFWQNAVQYTDYYGKMYYYNFDLRTNAVVMGNEEAQRRIGTQLPSFTPQMPIDCAGLLGTVISGKPYRLRKDNRERLQFNAQVEFVTNRKGLIIGSALAALLPFVAGDPTEAPTLYFSDEPINKFLDQVDMERLTKKVAAKTAAIGTYEVMGAGNEKIKITFSAFPFDCKSLFLVSPYREEGMETEDEEGNQIVQRKIVGGELLFGCNGDFKAGDKVDDIYFSPIHWLYKDSLNVGEIFEFCVLRTEGTEGTKYSCAFGMKWSEWVASSNNTDGYYISDGMVKRRIGSYVYTLKEGDNDKGKTVLSTDTVKRGYYFLYLSGTIM